MCIRDRGCIAASTDHKKHFSSYLFCTFTIPLVLSNFKCVGRKLDATSALYFVTFNSSVSTPFCTQPLPLRVKFSTLSIIFSQLVEYCSSMSSTTDFRSVRDLNTACLLYTSTGEVESPLLYVQVQMVILRHCPRLRPGALRIHK